MSNQELIFRQAMEVIEQTGDASYLASLQDRFQAGGHTVLPHGENGFMVQSSPIYPKSSEAYILSKLPLVVRNSWECGKEDGQTYERRMMTIGEQDILSFEAIPDSVTLQAVATIRHPRLKIPFQRKPPTLEMVLQAGTPRRPDLLRAWVPSPNAPIQQLATYIPNNSLAPNITPPEGSVAPFYMVVYLGEKGYQTVISNGKTQIPKLTTDLKDLKTTPYGTVFPYLSRRLTVSRTNERISVKVGGIANGEYYEDFSISTPQNPNVQGIFDHMKEVQETDPKKIASRFQQLMSVGISIPQWGINQPFVA